VLPQATAPRSAVVVTKKLHATKPVGGHGAKNAVCKVTLDYAEVFGLPAAVEAKINPKLAPAVDFAMPDPCDHGVETTATFDVAHNDDGVLSVRTTGSIVDAQAAHPSSGSSTVNVLLDTGADLKLLGDVVKPADEKAFRAALASAVDAVAKRDHWDADSKGIVVDALATSTSFLLEKQGIRVLADSLPHAMAALGDEGFLIPYAKLPRPAGRVAALWGK